LERRFEISNRRREIFDNLIGRYIVETLNRYNGWKGCALKRSEVGLGGSLSGIKWDYAGRNWAASRLIPDIPA
jgi:hypothetical protein